MNVLCTFPGKYGDLLWALPTVRAVCRRIGEAVDLAIPKRFESIAPLLRPQSYIGKVYALDDWITYDTAPISPREPPTPAPTQPYLAARFSAVGGPYNLILHLGYREWPLPDVCRHTLGTLNAQWSGVLFDEEELALETPWIQAPDRWGGYIWDWCYGFTDEYFELKFGVVSLLEYKLRRGTPPTCLGQNPRWTEEASAPGTTWEESAAILGRSRAFLGCNSALHVLAVAVGCPVVMMEPQTMRHNEIFFPLGKTGPQVTLVTGADGLPTFDARHTHDILTRTIRQRQQAGVPHGTSR